MKVAILCGGLATRLQPLTDNLPKSLIDIHGKPFVAWQLNLLRQQGLTNAVLCIGHMGHAIQGFVELGYRFGMNVEYSHDGTGHTLGTAGALRKALPLLGNMFYVLYGDSYLDACNYHNVARAFKNSGKLALMTVCQADRGNAVYSNGQVLLYDKRVHRPHMQHIDYGLSVMHREVLDGDEADLADVFHRLSLRGQLAGYEVRQKYHSIGSFEGLVETRQYLRGKQCG